MFKSAWNLRNTGMTANHRYAFCCSFKQSYCGIIQSVYSFLWTKVSVNAVETVCALYFTMRNGLVVNTCAVVENTKTLLSIFLVLSHLFKDWGIRLCDFCHTRDKVLRKSWIILHEWIYMKNMTEVAILTNFVSAM